jgi:hypothetical protein
MSPSPRSLVLASKRAAHGLEQRCRRGVCQALARHALPPLSSLSLPLRMAFRLPPPHSLSNALGNLLLLRWPNLAEVDALRHQLLEHLAHEVLIDVLGVDLGRAEQRPQAGLVLDGAWGQHSARRRGASRGRLPASRAPIPATGARVSARLPAPLAPPALSRRLQSLGVPSPTPARYARLAQTQGLRRRQHPLLVVVVALVALFAPSQLRQHIVPRFVFRPVRLFFVFTLPALGVVAHVVVEQRRHKGVGLRGPHRGAARGASVRVYRRRRRGLEREPFLQTGAAEGVQAVEQRERLVEQVGADLTSASQLASMHTLNFDIPAMTPILRAIPWINKKAVFLNAPELVPAAQRPPQPTSSPATSKLTEHVNSLSMSFCPPPARSASAMTILCACPTQTQT